MAYILVMTRQRRSGTIPKEQHRLCTRKQLHLPSATRTLYSVTQMYTGPAVRPQFSSAMHTNPDEILITLQIIAALLPYQVQEAWADHIFPDFVYNLSSRESYQRLAAPASSGQLSWETTVWDPLPLRCEKQMFQLMPERNCAQTHHQPPCEEAAAPRLIWIREILNTRSHMESGSNR